MFRLLIPILLMTVGCSSLFYYPTKEYSYDPSQLKNPPEVVTLKTKDDVALEAWYFPAVSKKPRALVVHFHGNAQNISTHVGYFYSLIKLDYDYFIFDYRGFGKSQGKPNPKGVINDGVAALNWARERAKRQNIPLVLIGQSLGGAILMRTLEVYEPSFKAKAVVIDSSFGSYRSVAKSVLSKHWLVWLFQPLGWLIVDNSQGPNQDYGAIKGENFLVIHGTSDHVIDYYHGAEVFKNLPEPKKMITVPNGRHTDFMYADKGNYQVKFLAWLDKVLSAEKK